MRLKKAQLDSLDDILDDIWSMLKRGVARYNDPFHWPVLGTSGKGAPSLRTVILRQFTLPDRILVCHTDSRAPKAQDIKLLNSVSWLFYHPKKSIQLRVIGTATLHTSDSLADDQWAATKITSRLNYWALQPPGTPIDKPSSGLPEFLSTKLPTIFDKEKGRRHFMAIVSSIDSIDWLMLSVMGNRRARFEWKENRPSGSWLIP